MALGSYRRLLAVPHVPALIGSALLARLPNGFANLALVIIVRERSGSYAVAGIAVGVAAVAAAVAAPLFGRLVDRVGQTRVLVPVGIAEGLVMCGFAITALAGAAGWALVVLSAPLGFFSPPISACLRALWAGTLPWRIAPDTAYSLESTTQELIFICGPLLAAAILAVAGAEAILIVGGTLATIGSLTFASLPPSRQWRATPHEGRRRGALAVPGVRTLVALAGVLVLAFSAVEVVVVAFTTSEGNKEASGIVLAIWAASSMLGGLVHGALRWRRPVRGRLLAFAALIPVGFVPLVLTSTIPGLAVAIVAGGVFIAPLLACVYTILGDVSPPSALTEAFSWLNTAFVAGSAVGAVMAGAVVQASGSRAGFAAVVAVSALCPLVVLACRESLRPAARVSGGGGTRPGAAMPPGPG
jgi:MFS family permease